MNKASLNNPGMSYRPVPFWSWNEKLTCEELRWQVREMHRVGLGGFFMHARGGLQTEYLSDEWMACVEACIDEAKKLGMNAWLYDENGWPSGFGGGLVNGLGVDYQQKYLRFEEIDASEAAGKANTIAYYSADGAQFLGRELPTSTKGQVLRAYYEINRYYVDNLDAKVVAEFIRVTHQHYYETLPPEYRDHLKGIFTDEPQLSRNGLLWSFVLEEEYKREYGRDLIAELPMLSRELPGYEAMRIRFWRLCAKLFTENFMHQIRDWCDAHGWWLTGHHVLEETCQSQLSSNGSIMAQYRYYHIPGIDHLCRSLPHPVMMTQVASTAAQFGQKQILTESFALSGWNCNFTGQRWIYNTQLAHGVNFLCQHLQGYSLRGLRKRDYPSSNFYHQPWWKDYAVVNDHFSRVGMLLAEGRYSPEVLVVHPLSSVWMQYDGNERKDGLNYYSEELRKLTSSLDALQVGHHYADELIAESIGSVSDKRLVLGECSYGIAVIPPVMNLSRTIYDLLVAFKAKGGRLYRVENTRHPGVFLIDGEAASADELAWYKALPAYATAEEAASAVANLLPNRVKVLEGGAPSTQVVSTWRDIELEGKPGRFHYLASNKYLEDSELVISLPKTGKYVDVIDPLTGDFKKLVGVTTAGDRLEFNAHLGACGSLMLFVSDTQLGAEECDINTLFAKNVVKTIGSTMTLAESTDNLLTLDRCRYRVDGGDWDATDVIQLQSRLVLLKRDADLEMEFEFQAGEDYDATSDLYLVVETPERFQFTLNGIGFPAVDTGYAFDKSFRKLLLPKKTVRPGRNVIGMRIRYHQPQWLYDSLEAAKKFETEYNKLTFETEMESVYLMGDFTVRHVGMVEALPRSATRYCGSFELGASRVGTQIEGNDLLGAGHPFFAGVAKLATSVELTADEVSKISLLRFSPLGANSWRVIVNGADAGTCFWSPYAVNVAGLLKAGLNTIEFELTQSLRNMLGPHHLQEGESYAVHTMSFNREANFVGRGAPPYNEGYCFVQVGIDQIQLG